MNQTCGLINQSTPPQEVRQINAVGLVCPLPILRLKKRTRDLPSGAQVEFLTDDPSGRKDLQTLCELTGHRIEWVREEAARVVRYRICLA